MPRISRKLMDTEYFHILVQGLNKDFIFNSSTEMEKYEKLLFCRKEDYNIKIIAYCIMNNHAHILVRTTQVDSLSSFMHKVNMEYANFYNKKHNHIGHVFRDRFKSEEIYEKEYLYNCINYIHKNPVKAGICKSEEQYRFSSYNSFKKHKDFFMNIPNSEKIFIDTVVEMQQSCDELIEEFLLFNGLDKIKLCNNKEKLEELFNILRYKNKMSYEKISKTIGIGRESLRRMFA